MAGRKKKSIKPAAKPKAEKKPRKKGDKKGPEKEGIAAFLTPEERHRLGRLTLLSRYVIEGNLAGAHRSPLKGQSSEFADHKAYGIGDDPKHIDWRVLARTDKYYVKRFQDETNLRVYLAVDRSGSMNYGSGDVTKYEYACHLAAAIGYVIVKARDSVGLYLHSEKIDMVMDARNSYLHLNNLLKQLQTHEPENGTDVAEALHQIAGKIRRRALVIVSSDLLGDQEAINVALAHLRKQHHDVIVFHVLDPAEIDLSFKQPCEFTDLETGETLSVNPRGIAKEYQKVFGEFLEKYEKTCASMKIDYRLARTDKTLDKFVQAYFQERIRLSK
jgi:uncharacterized protein (DUF58 family)